MCTSFLAPLRLPLALSLIHLHQQHRPSGYSLCLECCSPRSSELASYCLWSNLSYSMRPTLTTLLYTTGSYLTSSSSLSWLTLFFFFSWHLLASNMPYNLFVMFIVCLPQIAGKLHEVRDFFFFCHWFIHSAENSAKTHCSQHFKKIWSAGNQHSICALFLFTQKRLPKGLI